MTIGLYQYSMKRGLKVAVHRALDIARLEAVLDEKRIES